MNSVCKLLAIAACVTAILMLTATTATASRALGIEGERRTRGSDATVIFAGGEGAEVTRSITLEGTFASVVQKRAGEPVGAMTNGRVAEPSCRDNNNLATLRPTSFSGIQVPWRFAYSGIAGTLPNIASISLSADTEFTINVRVLGMLVTNCRYSGTIGLITDAPPLELLTTDSEAQIPRIEGIEEFCPEEMALATELALTPSVSVQLLT